MIDKRNPIGAIDSGVGGLTVVRELQRLLPGEDIVYFGDSANCPYGNKTGEQIFQLGRNMLTFLSTHHVKCVAVACNTLSSMVGRLRPCFDFHIVVHSIVFSSLRGRKAAAFLSIRDNVENCNCYLHIWHLQIPAAGL